MSEKINEKTETEVIIGPDFYQNQDYRKREKEVGNTLFRQLAKDGSIDEAKLSQMENDLKDISPKEILDKYEVSEEVVNNTLLMQYRRNRISAEEVSEHFGIESSKFLQDVAQKFNLEYADLDETEIDYSISEKISSNLLKRIGALPLKQDEVNVYVAFKNPFDLDAQEKVGKSFNRQLVKPVVAESNTIDKYMAKVELNESVNGIISKIRKELKETTSAESDSSAILELIEVILKTSISARASDIHVEPTEQTCIVRSRIDGMLTETFVFDKDIYPPLVSRLKLLSNMDIAEKRKPQDGRFSVKVMDKDYDFRISTLPVVNGESVVMRILDKSKVIISLGNLGMHPMNFKKFTTTMKAPYGIILVTGPTGSGKSTTLYAALNDIKDITKKVITVEDPVEYQVNGIQQVHVNERAGLTFASALRSILRQDPDIIMIGEIRDTETIRIAVQAALTGHLVFSTLHTNDSVSAITRIVDMGIESYLVSGALVCVEAQRLVRKLCPHCKQRVKLPQNMLDAINRFLPENYQFYKAVGCAKCAQTGYLGREMISEILPISDRIQSMIAQGASKDQLTQAAYEEGFIDMFHDGVLRAANGITTIEEIFRVAKV